MGHTIHVIFIKLLPCDESIKIKHLQCLQAEEEEERRKHEEEEARQRKEVQEFERKLEGRKHRRRNRHQMEPEEKPSFLQTWGHLMGGTAAVVAFMAFAVYMLVIEK